MAIRRLLNAKLLAGFKQKEPAHVTYVFRVATVAAHFLSSLRSISFASRISKHSSIKSTNPWTNHYEKEPWFYYSKSVTTTVFLAEW